MMATVSRQLEPSQSNRVPPHDIDAEMSLLGAMMLDRDAISGILPIFSRENADWFYHPDHARLFGVLVDMYDANQPIDLVTVQDELKRRDLLEKVGGIAYIVRLAESVPSATNAVYYANIVRDKGMLRDLISCASQIQDAAYTDKRPTNELIDHAEQKFFAVTERRITRQASILRELLNSLYAQVELHDGNFISGLPTGFTELDDLTSGFQRGDFIIIAGRPSMGKTALGLTIAQHMAVKEKQPVAFFSLEMSNQQIAQRVLCAEGEIDSHKFRRRMLSDNDVNTLAHVCETLSHAPLYVDDTPGMTILELRAKARRLVRQHEIKAIFVDYIQLMHSPSSESRQQEITTISRGLKALGRELNIPIISMAQLNRQSEGREGHRPRMSDLRESGALEQDADVIILIHREEYYKPQDIENQGLAEIIIAKQRNGPTSTVKVHFDKRLTRFANRHHGPIPAEYTGSSDVPF